MAERYLITSAQAMARPNEEFLKAIRRYNRETGAELVILPMTGQSAKEDWEYLDDKLFKAGDVEYRKRRLNNNIEIDQFHLRPQMIDPTTGLLRFAQRETTKVFASPKQRLRTIPHSNKSHPKFLVTPGAVTHPNYATDKDSTIERRRLGDIAKRDHIYGGLVVEIEDNKIFYMRHIRATRGGRFVDLGDRYTPRRKVKSKLEALVLGDYHVGRTDPGIKQATYEMIDELKPKRIILHDFFDGHSVSWHIKQQFITQEILQQLDADHTSLEKELNECYKELHKLSEISRGADLVIVASNHHEFLNRYLDEGRFMGDAENARYSFKLADYMADADYNDPVEAGIKMQGKLPARTRFLIRDEDYKIWGYQLGAHGDKGPGRGYGSLNSKEHDFGKSISGHVHKAQMLRETMTVGTMLPLNMYYMRGQPSDWSHSHAALWDNGSVQLLTFAPNGRYKLK